MFPFWNTVIAPILEAAGTRNLVEIGALRGENTRQIIEHLGPECVLHVIDPAPDFDPTEHQERFGGQYVFHRALSLDVLGDLPPMDAALIDGDHNWYTVYNELRLLRKVARDNDAPLPVLILHDVGWPYGRRDLYYEPSDIPDEYRQPWRDAGMRPGFDGLLEKGGLNPTMHNAEREGGPRNGVMTALEDFLAEHDKPHELLVIPIYFGLAIAIETERLQRQPALAEELKRIRSPKGKDQIIRLAERVRLQAMMFQHNVYYQRDDRFERANARYLKTVKAALLNEHYLENEARLQHLFERSNEGRPFEPRMLRDPSRQDPPTWGPLVKERLGPGGPIDEPGSFVPYTAMGRHRLDHLETTLDSILEHDVSGDLIDVGVGRGGSAIFMRAWLDGHEIGGSRVWVIDRFRATPEPRKAPFLPDDGVAGFRADLNLVRDAFERFDLLDDQVRFLQGPADATLSDVDIEQVSLIRLGHGPAEDAAAALDALYDRLSPGGFVIVHEQAGSEVQQVVDEFRSRRGITAPLVQVDANARAWQRPLVESTERPLPEPRRGQGRFLGAPADPKAEIDLTVVVVFYNMRREAARTLQALSRAYQEDIADLTYEVIAVDNGSAADQALDQAFVESFGPEFRLLDMADDAHPSPVRALNAGIAAGRGRAFALMIDGAHVVTPGVLHYGMLGLDTYAPAIVATQQWYTGPGQQGEAMDDGYDQDYEDRLFSQIDWPHDGYRLFEIGHFVGDRDWLDGLWESNCMFVTRTQIDQVGGFEDRFDVAGGGYANLELYERLGASADTTVVTMLGEGSFHQVHGGTTTNQPDPTERRARVYGYSQQYAEMRGRPFRGPGKPIHYVGRIASQAARRTKARRLSTAAFRDAAAPGGVDGPPTSPTPVPDDLRRDFVDAVWHSMPWEHTTWLGEPVATAPTDLLAYQEIITEVRPDWIVVTGTRDPGRVRFLASMCDLVGHGSVLVVGPNATADPDLPRVRALHGDSKRAETSEAVREIVGDGRALVVLGAVEGRVKTMWEFEEYSPMVPVGSYVVVTDTVVNGHPVWTGFGPGPTEAVKQILTKYGDFVADTAMEKHSLSFNPNGYLKRVR